MKPEPKFRCWAYHWAVPEGKIFESYDEYSEAIAEGWVEAPWLVKKPVVEKEEKSATFDEKAPKLCECGCGQEVTHRFAPGHYAKWAAAQKGK